MTPERRYGTSPGNEYAGWTLEELYEEMCSLKFGSLRGRVQGELARIRDQMRRENLGNLEILNIDTILANTGWEEKDA